MTVGNTGENLIERNGRTMAEGDLGKASVAATMMIGQLLEFINTPDSKMYMEEALFANNGLMTLANGIIYQQLESAVDVVPSGAVYVSEFNKLMIGLTGKTIEESWTQLIQILFNVRNFNIWTETLLAIPEDLTLFKQMSNIDTAKGLNDDFGNYLLDRQEDANYKFSKLPHYLSFMRSAEFVISQVAQGGRTTIAEAFFTKKEDEIFGDTARSRLIMNSDLNEFAVYAARSTTMPFYLQYNGMDDPRTIVHLTLTPEVFTAVKNLQELIDLNDANNITDFQNLVAKVVHKFVINGLISAFALDTYLVVKKVEFAKPDSNVNL